MINGYTLHDQRVYAAKASKGFTVKASKGFATKPSKGFATKASKGFATKASKGFVISLIRVAIFAWTVIRIAVNCRCGVIIATLCLSISRLIQN